MMKRVAAPMVGGLFTSFAMELLVYPAIYLLWRQRELTRTPHPARAASRLSTFARRRYSLRDYRALS